MAIGEAREAIAPTVKPSRTALQNKQTQLAWLLMTPTIAVILFVAAYPLVRTFYDSFTDAAFGYPSKFIGWTNFYNLLHDVQFRESIYETFKFAIITVVFEFVLGMGIALVVNSNFKGRGAMRTAMLVPWAIITVVNAQMWELMLNDTYGVLNEILVNIHGPVAPMSVTAGLNRALG